MREHRAGMVAWVAGGAAAMLVTGLALATEMRDFPGGPQALADSVLPAAEAMRPLRWPAERLDTLGGYLTYHNIVLFSAFLSVYAALQGARAIRRGEQRGSLEPILATGWSRAAVLRDQVLGFVAVLTVIVIGLAAGVAAAMYASGAPDLGGSFTTLIAVGLCALVAYMLALLVSQLVRTARAAAGIAVVVVLVLYVSTNVWEDLGLLGVVRFLSPFHYANQSRALVPGYGFDVASVAVLLAMSTVLLALAMAAFAHRDHGAALWSRRVRTTAAPSTAAPSVAASSVSGRTARVQAWWLRSVWTASLARHRIGLAAWALSAIAFVGLMMALQPTVVDMWSLFDFMLGVMGGGAGTAAEAQYTSFCTDVVAPIVLAYVITQAAGWVPDLEEGRVEAVLATPVSWARLVAERLVAVVVGVAVIAVVSFATILVGSAAVDADADPAGLARALVMDVLLGWALAAVAALAVALLRNGAAVAVLAVYVGAAYLLTWLVPMLSWPSWLIRASVFDAYGHPYQGWPDALGLLLLLALAVPGSIAAAAVAEHTPKVAT